MKRIWKIVGIALIVVLLGLLIWKISTQKEKPFNKFPLKRTHYVFNQTTIAGLDTIVHAGLQCLNVDSAVVVIRPFKEIKAPEDIVYKAYIVGNDNTYVLYINKFARVETVSVIAHELVHLTQYMTKKLVIDGSICVWNGDTIDITKMFYDQRPWERDAFQKQVMLADKMEKLLYE